jgi:hypothetical protein
VRLIHAGTPYKAADHGALNNFTNETSDSAEGYALDDAVRLLNLYSKVIPELAGRTHGRAR